jgi:pseudouridine-5'-phosphate glycosidase
VSAPGRAAPGQVAVAGDVRDALAAGRPVVALESAVATCGLPLDALGRVPAGAEGWDASSAAGLEAARLQQRMVRAAGAVPATVGVLRGILHVGLDDRGLAELVADGAGAKTSITGLAAAMAGGRSAGATVSAALAACRLTRPAPIRVLATGGIGGVHRGWTAHLDVSADLRALAMHAVCVVASGVKSILDAAATLEALEALGVPVVAFGTDRMPRFYCAPGDDLPAPRRCESVADAAALCAAHWQALGSCGGILLANPVPAHFALPAAEVEQALAAAAAPGAPGDPAQRTPELLRAVARASRGRAIDANVALLAGNARLAALLAAAIAGRHEPESRDQPGPRSGR